MSQSMHAQQHFFGDDSSNTGRNVEKELEIGRKIQASFLPTILPQPRGWEIAAQFKAARDVAGDFYDAFELSGGKRIGLVIADVCDKGVGAALFMALFRSLIRAFADQHYALGWMDMLTDDLGKGRDEASLGRRRALLSTGVTQLKNAIDLTNNYIIKNHGDSNMFATIFFGILDPSNGVMNYINGGHEPPLIVNNREIKNRLMPTGPAVGLWPGMEFDVGQVRLEPGDFLVAYTDGVTDGLNERRESYGEERLLALIENQTPETADDLLKSIVSDFTAHIERADQYDDITLLALNRII